MALRLPKANEKLTREASSGAGFRLPTGVQTAGPGAGPAPPNRAAHALLDQPVGALVKQFAPQYADKIPADKANQTFREVLKTSDFMTKAMILSVVGQHLPKGVTAEDLTKAVNEAPPVTEQGAEKPAAAAAPAGAPAPAAAPAQANQYQLPGPPPATRGPTSEAAANEHYRKMREPFAAELKDPATRRLLRGIISAENAGAGSAVAESLMNRTAMVNEQRAAKGQPPLTLKAMIQGDPSLGGGKSFYGPVRTGAINEHLARVDADKNYATKLDSHITAALGGADTIKGHTDQGSKGDPNYVTGGVGVNINGERFNDWGYGGSRDWREKNQVLASRSGGASSINPIRDGEGGEGSNIAANTDLPAERRDDTSTMVASAAPLDTSPSSDVSAMSSVGGGGDAAQTGGGSVGDIFSGLGDIFAKGPVAQNAARASTPANLPLPQMPTPVGATPTVDPKMAEMHRQMLAQALQRLNSGRLV